MRAMGDLDPPLVIIDFLLRGQSNALAGGGHRCVVFRPERKRLGCLVCAQMLLLFHASQLRQAPEPLIFQSSVGAEFADELTQIQFCLQGSLSRLMSAKPQLTLPPLLLFRPLSIIFLSALLAVKQALPDAIGDQTQFPRFDAADDFRARQRLRAVADLLLDLMLLHEAVDAVTLLD